MQLHPQTSTAELPDAPLEGTGPAERPPGVRKNRLLWSGIIAAVVLLLIFVPPLINANHYRLKIASSMSESLGRPVHLDNVKLHLLPVPGLTLSNLVVSEDPRFGDEPTIRADSVEATLRLGSLWRRRVEFSSVRFIEPHVNLVRDAEGRWNLADVLLHASHVDTAPTVQSHAGPTPRFPYIEATGGRVNVKLDGEKLPFSITDADFALWLPSPRVWRVRLTGQPARTDINVTDPGIVRLEGDLQRAGAVGDVPVNLRGSWHDAPMGEASRILTGNDMAWRGTLNLDASLAGTLGAGQVRTKLTLGDLRRADFAAVHPLDLQVTCGAGISVETVTLSKLLCTMPDNGPTPMTLQAAALNLQHPAQAEATLNATKVPVQWGLLWAALFSRRVPTDLHPAGTMTLSFEHLPAPATSAAVPAAAHRKRSAPTAQQAALSAGNEAPWNQWTGSVEFDLPPAPAAGPVVPSVPSKALPIELIWRTGPAVGIPGPAPAGGPAIHLQPTSLRVGADTTVTVTAAMSSIGYNVAVAGTASGATLLLPARYLPQLADGMDSIVPVLSTAVEPSRVDFTCTHPWGEAQTCTSLRPVPAASRSSPLSMPQVQRRSAAPLLAPRSLSPYDRAPQLGGQPAPSSPRL